MCCVCVEPPPPPPPETKMPRKKVEKKKLKGGRKRERDFSDEEDVELENSGKKLGKPALQTVTEPDETKEKIVSEPAARRPAFTLTTPRKLRPPAPAFTLLFPKSV